jgi:chromosome segregation ATPase
MDAKRTSEQVDKELQAERSTIKKLQAKLETAKTDVTKAEQEQDKAAYQALAHEDKAAQKRLEEAEERAAKTERHVKSYDKAIAQAMRRFEGLKGQLVAAYRREDLEKLKALVRKRIELAPRLDAVVNELLAVHGEFSQLTKEMLQLKQGLGLERLKLREDNLQEWLRVRLYPAFGEFKIDKTFGVYRERKSMAELETVCFERLLKMEDAPEGNGQGAANGENDEIQPAESEAGAEAGTGA